jgi:FixJ family two-component response regulator
MSTLCFDSAEQFLDSGARHKTACLIADVRMPGMSGIELQANLKSERCRIPIIFITGRGDIPLAVSAMKEGASDFFTKPVDGAALLTSVERALQQNLANRREATERASLVARYESLTPREREVLPLLAGGLLNKQVAFELGITEWTVQLHRGHIMRKMQADSFAALVMADKLSPDHSILPDWRFNVDLAEGRRNSLPDPNRDIPFLSTGRRKCLLSGPFSNSLAVKYRHTQISFSKESARSAILRERRRNDSICGENWL